jgi:D-ribulokinase
VTQGWNESFWKGLGLEDIVSEGYSRIGTTVLPPGSPVGDGLLVGVAQELGLAPGTPVGTAIIDAHAGGLGAWGSG